MCALCYCTAGSVSPRSPTAVVGREDGCGARPHRPRDCVQAEKGEAARSQRRWPLARGPEAGQG